MVSFSTQACAEFDSVVTRENQTLIFVANMWDKGSEDMGATSQVFSVLEGEDGKLKLKTLQNFGTKGGHSMHSLNLQKVGRDMLFIANYAGCGPKKRSVRTRKLPPPRPCPSLPVFFRIVLPE